MKKTLSFILIIATLVACLSSCNFNSNMSGALAGESEATDSVKEMMAALADDNTAAAKALLHPQVAETSDNAIAQMSAFLEGRSASAIELKGIHRTTNTGTAGTSTQDQVSYRVTLTDGVVIFISAVYLSNNRGTGFATFQVVLGLV